MSLYKKDYLSSRFEYHADHFCLSFHQNHLSSSLHGNTGFHLYLFKTFSPLSMQFSSVQFSCSVVSNSLRPHELQHARPPCPSPAPGVHSNSSIESVMASSHLFLCRPLLLLPPLRPSIRVFSNESTFCKIGRAHV